MRALGRDPDVMCITAKTVGLEPRSRLGTKEPIPDDKLELAIAKAVALNELGFALALHLQRLLGLRGLESLMSVSALEKYALEASELLNNGIRITKGTKGGRPRITDVIHARANETLKTIQKALVYMHAHGGYLIDGGKSGLKSARSKYHRLAKEIGLVGKFAPHSLRYAFATEKIAELRDLGYNRQEAMVLIAKYLGHGPSRARYISSVYGQTIVHTLPIELRKSRLKRAITNLEKLKL
jgi:integrase